MNPTFDGIIPKDILVPNSPDELAHALKRFSDKRRATVPYGGGTMMEVGAPLARAEVGLSLEQLSSVLDYQPENLVVRVQAGATWETLERSLAEKGQFVPLDPPRPSQATVGGILATNVSGALRLRYGTARDLVIGMRVALVDGQIVKGGGQVVKNVAGYDLPKLFIGSFGSLGVIVEATFKLAPMPKSTQTLVAMFDDLASAAAVGLRVLQSRLAPLSMVALNRSASDLYELPNACTLLVRFGGNASELARQVRDVQSWCDEKSWTMQEDAALWSRLRDSIFEKDAVVKIGVLPSQVGEIASWIEEIARAHQAKCALMAHSVGILYAALSGERIAEIIEEMRHGVERERGHLTIHRAPRAVRERVNAWGAPRRDWPVMRRLKSEFDPNGILNPGRFPP